MKILVAAFVPLVLVACAPLAPLPTGAAPSVQTAKADPVPAGPLVAQERYQVTAPADWRSVNDAQAEK